VVSPRNASDTHGRSTDLPVHYIIVHERLQRRCFSALYHGFEPLSNSRYSLSTAERAKDPDYACHSGRLFGLARRLRRPHCRQEQEVTDVRGIRATWLELSTQVSQLISLDLEDGERTAATRC
jgi:hypothetical protein